LELLCANGNHKGEKKIEVMKWKITAKGDSAATGKEKRKSPARTWREEPKNGARVGKATIVRP